MKYGPYICFGVVLAILFILWMFCGGKNYEFVGLAPLAPDTCSEYTGSIYNWGNITPATGYESIKGNNYTQGDNYLVNDQNNNAYPDISIDNTPNVQVEDLKFEDDKQVCHQEPEVVETQPKIPVCYNNGLQRRNGTRRKGRFISIGERMCCKTLERIYGLPFVSTWPDWLRNPETGSKLELDCYNDDLKIAVEYNGEQHYKWPNFTNQTYQEFINQARRDNLKADLCDKNGVYLITVPYTVAHNDIESYIMAHLPETIQKLLKEENISTSNQ